MVDVLILLLLVDIGLSAALLGWLYREKLDFEEIHERFDEMQGALQIVAEVLSKIPDMVPQFSINNNPLQPLIEAFAERMKQQWGSNPEGLLRDADGRFNDGAEEEQNEAA